MNVLIKASYDNKETKREVENKKTAYNAAREGIVLLKNDGVLPLAPQKIALLGAGAKMTIKGGSGSGEVNERKSANVLEGLESRGFTVTTKNWIDDYDKEFAEGKKIYGDEFVAKMMKKLNATTLINLMANPYRYPFGRLITNEDIAQSQTDACIYVLSRQAGEGSDRKLKLFENNISENEYKNIETCAKNYKKFILAVNVGATFDLSFTDKIENIGAIIFLCQQGTEGGNAFADIVCGNANPSGKLAVSWANKYEDIPFSNEFSYLNENLSDEYYKEGIYVGYRYFDAFKVPVRYEFGFGLSYTSFETAFDSVKCDKTKITVKAKVKNTGKVSGKEVVQLYLSSPAGELVKEYQSLAAFAKTKDILPNGEETTALTFDIKDCASFNEKTASFILDAGGYIIRLGNSSKNNKPVAKIHLDKLATVSKHQNVCAKKDNIVELVPKNDNAKENFDGLPSVNISAAEIKTHEYKYPANTVSGSEKVNSLLSKLSIKEMAELVIGAGVFGPKAHFQVPGSAGYTTSKLIKKGIANISLADGPAGVRLQRVSSITKKGKIKVIDTHIEYLNYLPALYKKFIFGNPEKDTLIYQYTTAFPVEMALAQTWNVELLEQVGKAISSEMTEYGVTFWLAPAMNIHRNPLCGRNFEYYSEDQFLTGKLAAAVTKGVQQTDGNFVTIKHFACNNQEDNRNGVSSNVSERALREIYLKGYSIAVKEGNAKGVMTSYNKINGVYTPNSYDLCTKVLRNEWGFDGLVMTDWMSTAEGLASPALAIKAGNDLIMPGSKYDKKYLLKALKNKELSEAELKFCAKNVLNAIENSKAFK